MKKVISVFFILVLLLSVVPMGLFSVTAAEINYDDFDIYDGILVEYIGWGGDVVIPSVDADGNPITEIDARAFMDNDTITSVVIPEGIKKIGSECFQYCDYLESVSLPSTLEKCGFGTFRLCTSLKSIKVPARLKNIPQDFCSGNKALAKIEIANGVETIGVYAFSGLANVSKIVIPASVTDIYGLAFSLCTMSKCEVTINNPNCDIGYMNGYKKGDLTGNEYVSAFSSSEHKTQWTFNVPKGSATATALRKFNVGDYTIKEVGGSDNSSEGSKPQPPVTSDNQGTTDEGEFDDSADVDNSGDNDYYGSDYGTDKKEKRNWFKENYRIVIAAAALVLVLGGIAGVIFAVNYGNKKR